jgi:hypothetical protein
MGIFNISPYAHIMKVPVSFADRSWSRDRKQRAEKNLYALLEAIPEAEKLVELGTRFEFANDVAGYRLGPGLIKISFDLFAAFRVSRQPDPPQIKAARTLTRALKALRAKHSG